MGANGTWAPKATILGGTSGATTFMNQNRPPYFSNYSFIVDGSMPCFNAAGGRGPSSIVATAALSLALAAVLLRR